jgi:alkaline phosphatase D
MAAALGRGSRLAEATTATSFHADRRSVDRWKNTNDRVWLGEQFWANPMEDWRVVNGAAECQTGGGDRNIHLITQQLTNIAGSFTMAVQISRVESGDRDSEAGFRIGIHSELNEHRSNCFAKNGIDAGIASGHLVIGRKKTPLSRPIDLTDIRLELSGSASGAKYVLVLTASTAAGELVGEVRASVPARNIPGNVALVSNFDASLRKMQGSRYRFSDWTVSGDAFTNSPEQKFGPILWSMYSLSDSRSDDGFVMKISALTGPLGENDNKTISLQIEQDGQWQAMGTAELDKDAWVATFRIPHWNEKAATRYRLVYHEQHTDGSTTESQWSGIIKANPTGRPLRVGTLTCQNDYGFPYEPVANNLVQLDPDMLYFSGDQIYESHGGYGLIRDPAEPAILNYLRKYYQFGWSFREAMRDRPTLCLPDDHDVFQGNIWGEGGAPMQNLEKGTSSKGGYREPARMVNVVHKTNVGHHPDYFDPTPSLQNISVYYGEMVYGDVSFAIIADRQWKSGPERVDTGSGRADHVVDPDFDTSALDKPGLVLLGERQEKFLRQWANDWRGHNMKVVLSQTVFAGVATHHGKYDGYLKADLDCGGWPQTARNNAIRIIRESRALHICGDQHLATLTQYGVDKQRDSNWAYCTPAISAGYPRWWRPDDIGMPHDNRPRHGLANTGEFVDGLGNLVYVFAVGNPEVGTERNRYARAHQKGSGFGVVTIDTQGRTYHLDAFRFLVDATDGIPGNQFPGWPVTIQQPENKGMNSLR